MLHLSPATKIRNENTVSAHPNMCQMTSSKILQEFHSERPNSPFCSPKKRVPLIYLHLRNTHTNNKLWWSTWKNCCLVTRERKLAMDIVTYVGDMGGARVKAHMVKHLYGTQVPIWGRQSIFCIHSCTHSCLKFLSQPTPSNNHLLSALLFTLRRKPSGNWVISIFSVSGQKPCTRII